MHSSNTKKWILISIGILIGLFLLWKFIILPFAAWISGHSLEVAVGILVFLAGLVLLVWYLGFDLPKNIKKNEIFYRAH
jgi:protein-S-isoprenylcysteine O-methyltransferase Ste14